MFSAGARRRCVLDGPLTAEIRSKSPVVAVQKRVEQQRCVVRNPLTLCCCQGNAVKQNDLAHCLVVVVVIHETYTKRLIFLAAAGVSITADNLF